MKKHHPRQNLSLTAFSQFTAGRALVLAALLALSACATTQQAPTSADRFDKADANRDGKLSRGETSDYLVAEIFASRDANHDARLTREEWSGGDAARGADFKKRDADNDGIVTIDEAIQYGRAHGVAKYILRDADKNRDGALDKAEVQAYHASREGPAN